MKKTSKNRLKKLKLRVSIPPQNRELSWLSFNERVLQEAQNLKRSPWDRLKFLSIFSSNRDEFFRVRIANLRRNILNDKDNLAYHKNILHQVLQKVKDQQTLFEIVKTELLNALTKEGVLFVNEKNIKGEHLEYIKKYYYERIKKYVVPIMLMKGTPFPYLNENMFYLAVEAFTKDDSTQYAIIEIPTDKIERFIVFKNKNITKIVVLEDAIRLFLPKLFANFNYKKIKSYAVKINRDSELVFDNDLYYSDLEKIENSLKSRKTGLPQRLVYDNQIPQIYLDYLLKRINVIDEKYLIGEGRYLNFKNFIKLPSLLNKVAKEREPIVHKAFAKRASMFDAIKERDILLHFPYHTFNHVINFLIEAAVDPKVTSIKMTLYRVAKNSAIIHTLIQALRAGKHVEVEIELKARFDEEHNIDVAKKLKEEGALVRFGFNELKCHAKLLLVSRRENNKIEQYLYFSSGNFNEETAKLYTDVGVFTKNTTITKEISQLFVYLTNHYKLKQFKHNWVSPFNLRKNLIKHIKKEIHNQTKQNNGRIWIKLNNLIDINVTNWLLKAAKAGVEVKIIVRSTSSIYMLPDYPNLEVISIVSDYLEHSRIFIFGQDLNRKVFISSADLMERNLDARIEICTPIFDKNIADQLETLLAIQLKDNTTARYIDKDQNNAFKTNDQAPYSAQAETYNFIKDTN